MQPKPPDPGTPEAFAAADQYAQAVATQAELQQAQKLLAAMEQRNREALRLYEPLPHQERFHRQVAKQVIFTSGNRGGKSLAGFVETARVVTGQDPHNKYPKRDGTGVLVGWDEKHITNVVYPYLFRGGLFRIFKDGGDWHAWHPWQPQVPKEETQPAGPLIPDRFRPKFAWLKAAQRVFAHVEFNTGWTLKACTSRGEPIQGFNADYVHIDEDIQRLEWYREMMARLMHLGGKLRWTAMPHARNDKMRDVMEMAEDEEKLNLPERERSVVHIHSTIYENPHIGDKDREETVAAWRKEGEEVYQQRALGVLLNDQVNVYPSFSKYTHDAASLGQGSSEARKIYLLHRGNPPRDWMRVMAVDPGHTMCAVLFAAVPPPQLGSEKFIYGELALQDCTAEKFGAAVADFIGRQHGVFQRFLIDFHGGALTSIVSGISPRRAYTAELRSRRIACVDTGHEFRSGSDDIAGREGQVRNWLSLNPASGEPTLFIDVERCPRLTLTLPRFKKKVINGILQEEANRRLEHDHIDDLEYLAADGLAYVAPPTGLVKPVDRIHRIMMEEKKRAAWRAARYRRPGGGGNSISLGPQG